MEKHLIYRFKKGFSLLEVIISLLIISITFLAYSQLIEQNLKSQTLKKDYLKEHGLKVNMLTIYVSDPDTEDYILQDLFEIKNIKEERLSRYRNFSEVNVSFTHINQPTSIIIIK